MMLAGCGQRRGDGETGRRDGCDGMVDDGEQTVDRNSGQCARWVRRLLSYYMGYGDGWGDRGLGW